MARDRSRSTEYIKALQSDLSLTQINSDEGQATLLRTELEMLFIDDGHDVTSWFQPTATKLITTRRDNSEK